MGLTPISKEENKRPGPREKFLNLLWGNVPWGLLHHHPSLSRWPRNKNNLVPEKILETFEGNQWKKQNDRSSGKQDNNSPDCWWWFDQFQMSKVFTADCLKVVILWQELDFTLIISPSHRLLTSLMLFQDFKMLTFYVFKSTVFSLFYSATASSIPRAHHPQQTNPSIMNKLCDLRGGFQLHLQRMLMWWCRLP